MKYVRGDMSLLVAFVVLRLAGVVHWSWLWVLSPLWIPVSFVAVLFALAWTYYTITVLTDRD